MKTIDQKSHPILTRVADASVVATNIPIALSGLAKFIAGLGQNHFGIEPPAFIEPLKYSKGLRLISSPLSALKSTHEAFESYEKKDKFGFISHAIASTRGVVRAFEAYLLVESLALDSSGDGANSLVGEELFKSVPHIIAGLYGSKLLVSKFEVFLLYFYIWMCKDQKARADFLKGHLQIDASLLKGRQIANADEIQGAELALMRTLGHEAIEHLKNNELEKLDLTLQQGACIEAVHAVVIAITLASCVLYNLKPEQGTMLLEAGSRLFSLANRANVINGFMSDLRSVNRAYDLYLVALSVGVIAALAITALLYTR
ncbi:MAG: hypothetical protein H7A40_02950 [Chlamydiales bacterium]|nr:hypothetical protein [Chlamydiales bacterium]